MKQMEIRLLGNGWVLVGLNFDVNQYSKLGCILSITELINFSNLNKVQIVNKTALNVEYQTKLIY